MLDFSICFDIKSVHPDLVWFEIRPTSFRIKSTNIRCSARSLRSEIMSSRRSNSSASDAPRGAVPLIGAVVMIPSFVVRSDSGDADTSEKPLIFHMYKTRIWCRIRSNGVREDRPRFGLYFTFPGTAKVQLVQLTIDDCRMDSANNFFMLFIRARRGGLLTRRTVGEDTPVGPLSRQPERSLPSQYLLKEQRENRYVFW